MPAACPPASAAVTEHVVNCSTERMHSVGLGWPRRGRPRAVGGGGRMAGTQQPRPAGPFVWKPECCASLLHRVWDLGATCRAIQQWVWAVRRTWGSPSWSSLRLFSSIRRWRSSSYSVSVMAPQFPARFGTAQAAGALICPNQLSAAAVSARKEAIAGLRFESGRNTNLAPARRGRRAGSNNNRMGLCSHIYKLHCNLCREHRCI